MNNCTTCIRHNTDLSKAGGKTIKSCVNLMLSNNMLTNLSTMALFNT